VWDALGKRWVAVDTRHLRPGLTVLLDAAAGGYTVELGWREEEMGPAPVVRPPTDEQQPEEGYLSDPDTPGYRFVSLAEHSDHVVAHLGALCDRFPFLAPPLLDVLSTAARWHDAGKAHPVFQRRLTGRLPGDDPRREGTTWSKGPKEFYEETEERRYFRHELASALAMLQAGLPDLSAYLAAAHHGKVRLSIRSMPDEKGPPGQPDVPGARGIWEGDLLPETDLGGATLLPKTTLSLAPMELGESEAGPSWLARCLALREELGPFRLAFLEALLRVADWRASEEEATSGD
jgi:CRISPR-associated endonuclease/helicase Cas3